MGERLQDILRQISNRNELILYVVRTTAEGNPLRNSVYTLLEDNYEDAQELVDLFCVKNDRGDTNGTPPV